MNTIHTPILSADIVLHDSELLVADLHKMTTFYHEGVGFDIIEKTDTWVSLGDGDQVIIRLLSRPALSFAAQSEAGLFHNAILFASRAALASTLLRMLQTVPELYTGSGNHLVSEAFYFNDPEGNGVEAYYDLPRETWQWDDGIVKMDTLYIDPVKYINDNAALTLETDKRIGHIHLKIGDVDKARVFYVDTLGFSVTASFPGALFVAVGGYHHRIGMNTWLSDGAGPRKKTLGYSNVVMTLANEKDIQDLKERLDQAAIDYTYQDGFLRVSDPWKNDLTFTVR